MEVWKNILGFFFTQGLKFPGNLFEELSGFSYF